MILHRKYTGHYEDVTCLDWSSDSRFFVTGSEDATCRVFSLDPIPGYEPVSLTAHRDRLVSVHFCKTGRNIYSVSHDGVVLYWKAYEEDQEINADASSSTDEEGSGDDDNSPLKRRKVPGVQGCAIRPGVQGCRVEA